MKPFNLSRYLVCLFAPLWLCLFSPSHAAEQATPIPSATNTAADFFNHPAFRNVILSPNGKHMTVLVPGANGRLMLVVIELASLTPKTLAYYNDADIAEVHWVNNERLVFSLTDNKVEPGENRSWPGLYAINRDGTNLRQLVKRYWNFLEERSLRKILQANTFFHDVIHTADSDDIYVQQIERKSSIHYSTYNLLRLNTVTGNATPIHRPGKVLKWLIDKSGQPKIAETYEDNITSIFYKENEKADWRKIFSYEGSKSDFNPEQLGPDGTLYVSSSKNSDKTLLYRFNFSKNELEKDHLVSLGEYDFDGRLIFSKDKLLGVRYETDADSTLWFDADMKALQKEIDTLLPSTINTIATRDGSENVVIEGNSDVEPGTYYIYNRNSKKLTPFGHVMPKIDAAKMANKDLHHYKARDGLNIPAYLTLPKGVPAKNLPMILMVHGGPNVRGGHWNWEPISQFLASRGYAVLEPDFRGSTGYGKKHYQAGLKQWGLAMQDDLVDGVKWAIAQGYADPKRICIAGASYGGYATMMGLIRDPELFQCGVSWVGVSDINLMFTESWSDTLDESREYWMPEHIGDPKKDAAQFKATSPLEQAHRLKLPLILAYGGEDRRVPIVHGTKFYNAVKSHNPNVEWIEYSNEGHGWYFPQNNIDFWTKVETFLNKYTAPKAAGTSSTANAKEAAKP